MSTETKYASPSTTRARWSDQNEAPPTPEKGMREVPPAWRWLVISEALKPRAARAGSNSEAFTRRTPPSWYWLTPESVATTVAASFTMA